MEKGMERASEALKAIRPSVSGVVSPSTLLVNGLKQQGFSLTLGVFLGAALTSGAVCGAVAFAVLNETVLRRLRRNAALLAISARDAALGTLDATALSNAFGARASSAGDLGEEAARLLALIRTGRKAVCAAKNYDDHITELASLGPEWKPDVQKEPAFFIKPTTAIAWPGQPLTIPRDLCTGGGKQEDAGKHGVHHELELGVIIGRRARHVESDDDAMDAIAGYVVALDITDRDGQTRAKRDGMPWTVSKGRDSFLPISAPFTLAHGEDWRTLRLWLKVNGEQRQACEAGVMIHGVPKLIRHASSVMTLEPGDLIATGTPAGVGRVVPGDVITAGVRGHVEMKVRVVEEERK